MSNHIRDLVITHHRSILTVVILVLRSEHSWGNVEVTLHYDAGNDTMREGFVRWLHESTGVFELRTVEYHTDHKDDVRLIDQGSGHHWNLVKG